MIKYINASILSSVLNVKPEASIVLSMVLLITLSFPLAFADQSEVTIITADGSGAPGCEETSEGCYIPSTATVDVGGKVIMSNTDTAAHTFTSGNSKDGPDGIFDTSLLMAGSYFEYYPDTVGEIPYWCMVHPWMMGLIIVQEAEAEENAISIVVSTDKSSYSEGETIRVTGEVRDLYSGTPVSMIVKDPNGTIVAIAQLTVDSDKTFGTELTAGASPMKSAGTYLITVQYGATSRTAETTFSFGGSSSSPGRASGNIPIGDFGTIDFKITGGTLNIIPDVNANSLIVSIDATSDGSLTLTIPRSILDATMNGEDDDFFVLIDGEEFDFQETKTSTDRTITIEFPAGAEEIEILGTSIGVSDRDGAEEAAEAERARLAAEAAEAERARLAAEAAEAERARLAAEEVAAERARLAAEAAAERARLADEEETDPTLWIVIGVVGAAVAGGIIVFVTRKKKPSDDSSPWKDTLGTQTTTSGTGRKCNVCGTNIPQGVKVCPSCGDTYS